MDNCRFTGKPLLSTNTTYCINTMSVDTHMSKLSFTTFSAVFLWIPNPSRDVLTIVNFDCAICSTSWINFEYHWPLCSQECQSKAFSQPVSQTASQPVSQPVVDSPGPIPYPIVDRQAASGKQPDTSRYIGKRTQSMRASDQYRCEQQDIQILNTEY